jgi:UDP-N-acetylglucosamine diphosphorylase/glucosamine-1-phosphate N-acetyltransferase
MSETVILFEDEGYRPFLPLVHTRPVFDLRCGIFTLRERLAALLGRAPAAICRSHLSTVYGGGRWPLGLLGASQPLTFVNGRALDLDWLPGLLDAPDDTVLVADTGPGMLGGPVLLGARLSPRLASAVLLDMLEQRSATALAELRRFTRVVEVDARLLAFPWDIITANGEQIVRDLPLLIRQGGWPTAAERRPAGAAVVIHNPAQVYVHPDAKLEGPLVLDARDGPIVIDAARVEPSSFIQGPAAIGAGALIASARIRGETTIGPVCRIGGEVEASVIQGYSNKHHDGFLGHSYLGEWVNIGAMTTNSDLKNTYGSIRVVLDGFGQRQQAALEGLLTAASGNGGSPLGDGDDVELIINGDGFDFQMAPPYGAGGVMDASLAMEKLRNITAAHRPFFQTLYGFVRQPGRHITFLTGNHDVELCFAEVRAGIMEALGLSQKDERVSFCPSRSYRPLPDVYIEHGNAYDFWNHDRSGFWDASGHVRTACPLTISLPMDTLYLQYAGHPVLAHYMYLILFEPLLTIPRQLALICLLDRVTVVEFIQHMQELLATGARSQPAKKLLDRAPNPDEKPVTLFLHGLQLLIAFQQEAVARAPGWKEPLGRRAVFRARMQMMMDLVPTYLAVRRGSHAKDQTRSIRTICAPSATLGDSVAAGIHPLLKSDQSLRYALAGHTHKVRLDTFTGGKALQQVYLNTGSWLSRLALPRPEEVTAEMVAWLHKPTGEHIPLRDVPPRCTFAFIQAANGEPANASLCLWEGGSSGQHRILAF